MPRYRVREGHTLPHGGAVLPAGAELELPAHVAADTVIAYRVEPVIESPRAAAASPAPSGSGGESSSDAPSARPRRSSSAPGTAAASEEK